MSGRPIELAGEGVVLRPERALHWPRRGTLLIADPHFGKAADFRAAGIPVPEGGVSADLARLDRALAATRAERLIVLGDLLHGPASLDEATRAALSGWRSRHRALDPVLIPGNHDRGTDGAAAIEARVAESGLVEAPFVLRHRPAARPEGYVLAGHLHPAIAVRDAGSRARLPCFHFGRDVGVLPAFGGFTGSHTLRPERAAALFAVTPDGILPVPAGTAT